MYNDIHSGIVFFFYRVFSLPWHLKMHLESDIGGVDPLEVVLLVLSSPVFFLFLKTRHHFFNERVQACGIFSYFFAVVACNKSGLFNRGKLRIIKRPLATCLKK